MPVDYYWHYTQNTNPRSKVNPLLLETLLILALTRVTKWRYQVWNTKGKKIKAHPSPGFLNCKIGIIAPNRVCLGYMKNVLHNRYSSCLFVMVINRLFNWKNWADCKQIYKHKKYCYIELGEKLLSIVDQMVPPPLKDMSAPPWNLWMFPYLEQRPLQTSLS